MSRESIVTQEVQDHFRAMLSVGLSRRRAAHLLGFSESTIRNAMHRNEDFAKAVLRVERNREILALRNVQEAGAKSWRASKWFLENIHHGGYGRPRNDERLRKDFDVQTQTIIDVILSEIPDRALVDKIAKKLIAIDNGDKLVGPWVEGIPPNESQDAKLERYRQLTWLESLAEVEEEEEAAEEVDAAWDGPQI